MMSRGYGYVIQREGREGGGGGSDGSHGEE